MVCPCLSDGPIPATTPKTPMATINSFASSIHIHHHTYFKSSYVYIQVFHILHHHTMKWLLAFKSFLPRRPTVEISSETGSLQAAQFGSENWFAASATISAAQTGSLQVANFGSENYFAAANSVSAANHNFAAGHTIRQRMLIRCRKLSFGSESQIRSSQLNFDSDSQIRCKTHISTANANPLQTTQFRQ